MSARIKRIYKRNNLKVRFHWPKKRMKSMRIRPVELNRLERVIKWAKSRNQSRSEEQTTQKHKARVIKGKRHNRNKARDIKGAEELYLKKGTRDEANRENLKERQRPTKQSKLTKHGTRISELPGNAYRRIADAATYWKRAGPSYLTQWPIHKGCVFHSVRYSISTRLIACAGSGSP